MQHGIQEVLLSHDLNDVILLVQVFKPVAHGCTAVYRTETVGRSVIGFEHITNTNRQDVSITLWDKRYEVAISVLITRSTSIDPSDAKQSDRLKASVQTVYSVATVAQQDRQSLTLVNILQSVSDVSIL